MIERDTPSCLDPAMVAAIRFHDDMVDRYEANRNATDAGEPPPTELREVLRLEHEVNSHVKALATSVKQALDDLERPFNNPDDPHPCVVSNTLGSTWRMLVSSALGTPGSAPPTRFAADRAPAPSV